MTDDIDHEDVSPPALRREWAAGIDEDRRHQELRDAIRDGWPAYVKDPNDPEDEDEDPRPVNESEIVEFANLCARRNSRLDLIILRRRFVEWVSDSAMNAESPDLGQFVEDATVVIDEMISNRGGVERGTP